MAQIPLQRQSVWARALRKWFNPLGRNTGMLAFALNRITGLGILLYLLLHLAVLSILVRGEGAWNSFLTTAHTPLFLLFDVILLAGLLIHGLNGLRLALVGMGFATDRHQAIFWGLMAVVLAALAFGSWRFFVAG